MSDINSQLTTAIISAVGRIRNAIRHLYPITHGHVGWHYVYPTYQSIKNTYLLFKIIILRCRTQLIRYTSKGLDLIDLIFVDCFRSPPYFQALFHLTIS